MTACNYYINLLTLILKNHLERQQSDAKAALPIFFEVLQTVHNYKFTSNNYGQMISYLTVATLGYREAAMRALNRLKLS